MQDTTYNTNATSRLHRTEGILGGVAAGVGKRYGYDASTVRLAMVVALFLTGPVAIFGYIAAWILIPDENGQASARRNVTIFGRTMSLGLAILGAVALFAIVSLAIDIVAALPIGWMILAALIYFMVRSGKEA